MNDWVFVGSCAAGELFKLQSLNVWDHEWQPVQRWPDDDIGLRAEVRDPLYRQVFHFHVYRILCGDLVVEFAAGEFSNCVWGFYQRRS